MRYINGHNRRKPFHDLYTPEERGFTTPCWMWQGGTDGGKQGYGIAWDRARGKNQMAHRLAWEQVSGPVPEGMVLDHLCNIRRCVNPAHLEVVTPGENNRRMWERRKRNRGQAVELLDTLRDRLTDEECVQLVSAIQRLLDPSLY